MATQAKLMPSATLKALKGSVTKYGRIVGSTKAEDRGQHNCPLCKLFLDHGCEGCPVLAKTGYGHCNYTPYREWEGHQIEEHRIWFDRHRIPGCKECLRLAKAELAFLRSLLPKVKKPRSQGRAS